MLKFFYVYSLGVTTIDLHKTGERQIRCNVIMLRGVDELSTTDIFSYFGSYPPSKLEWIDDSSCTYSITFFILL